MIRRNFLQTLGKGALGLGAFALLPSVPKTQPLRVIVSTTEELQRAIDQAVPGTSILLMAGKRFGNIHISGHPIPSHGRVEFEGQVYSPEGHFRYNGERWVVQHCYFDWWPSKEEWMLTGWTETSPPPPIWFFYNTIRPHNPE